MKKQNLKSLSLNKKMISKLDDQSDIKGGMNPLTGSCILCTPSLILCPKTEDFVCHTQNNTCGLL